MTLERKFKIFVGKSFSQSFVELADSILSTSSSIKAAETAYTTSNADISEKLDKLATKEKLLTTRYTTQFGEMEQAMTQFHIQAHLTIMFSIGHQIH